MKQKKLSRNPKKHKSNVLQTRKSLAICSMMQTTIRKALQADEAQYRSNLQ